MEVISYLKSTLLTKDNKCSNPKGHLNPSIYSNNVHNNQVMERAQMSINRCMAKEDVDTHTHTHIGILVIKKNGILPFATMWLELELVLC